MMRHPPPQDDVFNLLWRLTPIGAAIAIALLIGCLDL